MANKYQSTKSGRQIDASVDYTEQLPKIIENINLNISDLNIYKADKNTMPRKTSDLTDDLTEQSYNPASNKPQSGTAVAEAIANLLGTAPENLDTLEELAKALNEDENFAAKVIAELTNKVDKVDGKGLSTNDFTDADKEKLDGIEEGANKTTVDSELLETSTNPVQNKVVLEALNEKAGSIINSVSGEAIQLTDSSNEKLKGLKVFGKTKQNKSTLGINILNSYGFCARSDAKLKPSMTRSVSNSYGTTISTTDFANELVITQSEYSHTSDPDSYFNGYFSIGTQKLLAGNTYTFVYEFEEINNPLKSSTHPIVLESEVRKTNYNVKTNRVAFTFTCVNGTEAIEIRCCGRSMIMKNFMLLEGAVALEDLPDFEPYTGGKPAPTPDNPQDLINIGNVGSMELYVKDSDEKQTFIINTRNGLKGVAVENNGNYTDSNGQQYICDEIDFAKGIYIQRIGQIPAYSNEEISTEFMSTTGELSTGATVVYVLSQPIEIPLTDEEIATYNTMQTYKPTTIITNKDNAYIKVDYGADTKSYIDNKFAELKNAIISTGGNV